MSFQIEDRLKVQLATPGVRFGTFILDLVVYWIFIVGVALTLEALNVLHEGDIALGAVNIIVYFLYYTVSEHIFCKTLGKYFMRTKVLHEDGGKTKLKNIVIRNLVRLVFLEWFTFLIGPGFHDKLSKTIVTQE